jgi:hypothetical protein
MMVVRKGLLVLAALIAVLALAVPAEAAPTTNTHGGVVRGNWIIWNGGAVQLSLTPMAFSDCPSGWLCLWQDSNYSGRMLKFHDAGYWQNLTNYGFNDEMSSWRNRRGLDAKWSYDINGGGTRRCMDAGASASSVNGNDEASSIKIFTTNVC